MEHVADTILKGLTKEQRSAVASPKRRILVVAGAGSGKTEIMARRVAWWARVDGVQRSQVVAFTFTKRAAEEMKFRIRSELQKTASDPADAILGDMYVGTIHSFCLEALRWLRPNRYHNYDILEEAGRIALVQSRFFDVLGLQAMQNATGGGMFATMRAFLEAYDLLNEFDELRVELPNGLPPAKPGEEQREWCKKATLLNDIGDGPSAAAFATCAARFYALMRCRRFLDFSTSQTELLHALDDAALLTIAQERWKYLVVDEVQDLNEVQDHLVRTLVGADGRLTAVGDHRQAIFGWRGGSVDIMARLDQELRGDAEGEIVNLTKNFRSTPRIIDISNLWAESIGRLRSMETPRMRHGRSQRLDADPGHVAALVFDDRASEGSFIAEAISRLCPSDETGAAHDRKALSGERGLSHADVAVLVRSSTDARTYMEALERRGIPAVFRAGPDLFSQPEVLAFLASLGVAAGESTFVGASYGSGMPARIQSTLSCTPDMRDVTTAACARLQREGLDVPADAGERLLAAAELIQLKISSEAKIPPADLRRVRSNELRAWLRGRTSVRRVFPQKIYHMLLAEADVGAWGSDHGRARAALFHLGQLSTLIKALETPGWVEASDFRYQLRALFLWGAGNARAEEAPLLTRPEAVTITTIHSAKGLEFPAVFLADVASRRFPSQKARSAPSLPFEGQILERIDPQAIADNANLDGERRLMYVALTRAERYLIVSTSKPSPFFKRIAELVEQSGGVRTQHETLSMLELAPREYEKGLRLVTSFSDLRYYLECPHDFYLRKVLGFAPTIDQAFGYGKGVHNLMRAVHSDPERWAMLAEDTSRLRRELADLADQGVFYLRYTTGEPLERMRAKAVDIVASYVETYASELRTLQFEPERPFETLLEEVDTLVGGAMDVIRLDDPPRVTLIDFKSGEVASDLSEKLDEDEMRLQVTLYGLAAKRELEYEPDQGLVRYLGEADPMKRELSIPLDADAIEEARRTVVATARAIRAREFKDGPRKRPRTPGMQSRCQECDLSSFCDHAQARAFRGSTA